MLMGRLRIKKQKKVNSVNQQMASHFGVPEHVRDAARRQYSGKGYTTNDKKTIINYYKTKA